MSTQWRDGFAAVLEHMNNATINRGMMYSGKKCLCLVFILLYVLVLTFAVPFLLFQPFRFRYNLLLLPPDIKPIFILLPAVQLPSFEMVPTNQFNSDELQSLYENFLRVALL